MMRPWLFVLVLAAAACGEPATTPRDISPEELLSSPPPEVVILDVRTPAEFAIGRVPGAVLIPHDELANRLSELEADPETPVVVYCEAGRRAALAESTLADAGFRNVRHLEGDMRAWREARRPTERSD